MTGIAISLLTCAYGFSQAKYKLTFEDITSLTDVDPYKLMIFEDIVYDNDVDFKNHIKTAIGNQSFDKKRRCNY